MLWEKFTEYCTKRAIRKYGESNGKVFMRCLACNKIHGVKQVLAIGVCPTCHSSRFTSATLTFWQELRYVFF